MTIVWSSLGGSAGAVNDFDMSERDGGSVHGDEGFDLGRELGKRDGGQEQDKSGDEFAQRITSDVRRAE